MTSPHVTRALFRCDGGPIPSQVAGQRWDVSDELRTAGPKQNLTLKVENLTKKLTGGIAPRVLDLFRIATYAYGADREVIRVNPVQPDRRKWHREFTLYVPVAEPEFWGDPETQRDLTEALGFGTEDRWSFVFTPPRLSFGQVSIGWEDPDDRDRDNPRALYSEPPDAVLLFREARIACEPWSRQSNTGDIRSLSVTGPRPRSRDGKHGSSVTSGAYSIAGNCPSSPSRFIDPDLVTASVRSAREDSCMHALGRRSLHISGFTTCCSQTMVT